MYARGRRDLVIGPRTGHADGKYLFDSEAAEIDDCPDIAKSVSFNVIRRQLK